LALHFDRASTEALMQLKQSVIKASVEAFNFMPEIIGLLLSGES
jgi:hypothetical protein